MSDKLSNKVDNLREHLTIIRLDINSEVERLSLLKKDVERHQNYLKEIIGEHARLRDEITSKYSYIESLAQRETKIRETEKALTKRELELDSLESEKRAILTKEEQNLQMRIRTRLDELNALEVNFERSRGIHEAELARINAKIKQCTLDEINARSILSDLSKDIGAKSNELDNLTKELNSVRTEIETEKDNLALEKTKKLSTRESLIEREAAIEKRERDFLIIKGRLAKVLNRLYPEQNIDNLI